MKFVWEKISKISSSFLSGIVLGLPIYITVNDYFFSVARVEGASMKPTLNPQGKKQSDFVFIDRWHIQPQDIQPGDIVALTSPSDRNVSFIKRVVGIEGDFLNTPRYRLNSVMVPRGHCWVEGDNYRSSLDSNKFGPISMGLIKGKAMYVVWPPSRWSRLNPTIPDNLPTERLLNTKTYKRPATITQQDVIPKTMDLIVEIGSMNNDNSKTVESDADVNVSSKEQHLVYNVEMLISDKPTETQCTAVEEEECLA